jgi:hypothetical protein
MPHIIIYMAARKRTEVQTEYDQQVMVRMKHEGRTYEEIQEFLKVHHGRNLSLRQLKYDMKKLRTRWAKQNMKELSGMVAEELARIEAMEGMAWKKFYACTGTRNKETIEQAVPMVKNEDGIMVPDLGIWAAKKRVMVSEDSSEDERFWWGQVTYFQEERRKLLGLYRTKIEFKGEMAHKVKGYVGWTPQEWDAANQIEGEVAIEGQFEETDNG